MRAICILACGLIVFLAHAAREHFSMIPAAQAARRATRSFEIGRRTVENGAFERRYSNFSERDPKRPNRLASSDVKLLGAPVESSSKVMRLTPLHAAIVSIHLAKSGNRAGAELVARMANTEPMSHPHLLMAKLNHHALQRPPHHLLGVEVHKKLSEHPELVAQAPLHVTNVISTFGPSLPEDLSRQYEEIVTRTTMATQSAKQGRLGESAGHYLHSFATGMNLVASNLEPPRLKLQVAGLGEVARWIAHRLTP